MLAGGLALAACGRPRPGARTLRLWAMSYEGDYAPLVTPGFTAATGVDVSTQSLPWTAAHEKLLTAHAGGRLPDVFMLPTGWVGEFALLGALAPVEDQALMAGMVVGADGRSVPWSVSPYGAVYRRDLLAAAGYDAPPGDWAGLIAMGRALKRRRPDGFVLLALLNWPELLFTLAGQVGAGVLREHDTRGNFAESGFGEALAFYVRLFDEGLAPRVLSTEVQDPLGAFAAGYFAIYPGGPTLLLDLKRRAAQIPRARWATARMAGPRGSAAAPVAGACLCVSARSERKAQAWALVRHLTSVPVELRLQRLIGNLPARAEAWRDPQMAQPVLAPFAAQLAQPAREPAIVEWERVRGEVQLVAERVVRRELTQAAGLRAMDRRVDALLAKRRALVQAGVL